mgnify:CR=1 FL=1
MNRISKIDDGVTIIVDDVYPLSAGTSGQIPIVKPMQVISFLGEASSNTRNNNLQPGFICLGTENLRNFPLFKVGVDFETTSDEAAKIPVSYSF